MKNIILIFLCVALCVGGTAFPAFATDEEPETETTEDPATVLIPEPSVVTPTTVIGSNVSIARNNNYTGSLSQVVHELFGAYTPRTQTVTEYLSDGSVNTYTEVVPGLAGLDWPWLTTVLLFSIVIYCVLRMIGGLLKWN